MKFSFNLSFGKKNDNAASKNNSLKYKQKNAVTFVKKNTPVFVIKIDIFEKIISIMNMIGNDLSTINFQKFQFKTRPFDDEFYNRLQSILNEYMENKPSSQSMAVYMVLSNECFSSELIYIPTVNKKQMNDSLDITITSSYKNKNDLIINYQVINTNKQYSTYQILSVRKELISKLYATLASCKLYCKYSSYISNSLVNSVFILKPKFKNSSFLFVDIKHDLSYFSIVYKGKTIGFYFLQFGYKILESTKLVYENMLSNHDLAEITVLNAKEKAKSKQLTVLSDENSEFEKDENSLENTDTNQKVYDRKVPKKLPKFMQRDFDDTEEGICYENFRIFVKWMLLILNNYNKNNLNLENIIVNLPSKYNYLIEMANNESNQSYNFIAFSDGIEMNAEILENLDLYGALFMHQFNKKQVL